MAGSANGLVKWQFSNEGSESRSANTNVWKQMSYVPPRGPCGYKGSLLTPTCPCLRFMIHPIKAPTTFECDGCTHHASFHQMKMKLEEDLATRWTNADGSFNTEVYRTEGEVQTPVARHLDFVESGDSTYDASKVAASRPKKKRTRSEESSMSYEG